MIIKYVEITNFRKLKSTHIDFDERTTIFVGANNSGKTSAMTALQYFLLHPQDLSFRDITISHWIKINELGLTWEKDDVSEIELNELLPSLDIWLDVPISEINYIAHILPTLDWAGGLLGVRLQYRVKDITKLKEDFLNHRTSVRDAKARGTNGNFVNLQIWPKNLTDYFERRLHFHIALDSFTLDPSLYVDPINGIARPQILPYNILPLTKSPFQELIKIDEIAAQRDFADAGSREHLNSQESYARRFKRRLSEQLRTYYDRHLDPTNQPTEDDYDAINAIQTAEQSFDKKLADGFASAFQELEDLGYPGFANPKLQISTQLRATDGLKHDTAVQYLIADPLGDGSKALMLPENYCGLGYQNLIAMVFMLMSFRDDRMKTGKASKNTDNDSAQIAPLHLVLVEEPEAHLHAQVQQVFINKAYSLLRKHPCLNESTNLCTQLIVSTHSSHIAHEADFSNLRYFRRHHAKTSKETATTTVANLSCIFGDGDETRRFVKRYLKATHCDLFFADGIIFVEGQAERILVPHFIRHHFHQLCKRYITLVDLGGSHAHKFKDLVDELGVATLVIADLDAVKEMKTTSINGKDLVRRVSVKPEQHSGQVTSNPVLKSWHPRILSIDELVSLDSSKQILSVATGPKIYVTYQKLIHISDESGDHIVIPRTFEDALIHKNRKALQQIEGSSISRKVKTLANSDLNSNDLEDKIFELLKDAEKAAFALDCLSMKDPKAIEPPDYIWNGLTWLGNELERDF